MSASRLLSILIPVRAQAPEFALSRLAMRIDQPKASNVIITDDGSDPQAAVEIKSYCEARGWTYQRLDTVDRPFSLSRARNAGLNAADTHYVFFDDLDMIYPSGFFGRLVEELDLLDMLPLSFLSLPAVYLTERMSSAVMEQGRIDPLQAEILSRMQFEDPRGSPDNVVIQSFAPASAILAMTREMALAAGGYDESFEGWGGEDRDFVFRLLCANRKLPRPSDFTATRIANLNDTHRFEGWRALHRLHGDYLARKGMYSFHLHHQPNAWRKAVGRSNIETAALKIRELAQDASLEHASQSSLLQSLLFSTFAEVAVGAGRKSAPPRRAISSVGARWRKLRRDPHRFFTDSRFPFGKALARMFRKRIDEA